MISDTYQSIKSWLNSHDLLTGYTLQFRKWVEVKGAKSDDRYIVILPSGGSLVNEAVTNDYFRIAVISATNDTGVTVVNDHADKIRQSMIDDFEQDCIINMSPVGGVTQYNTEEGRFVFEINAQLLISR